MAVIPVATYSDAGSEKETALKDNKNKSGIYRWTNLINGKSYVGSSVNLSRRFRSYFNGNYLIFSSAKTMLISKALLKYGYINFRLEILEYCDKSDLLAREQYFLNNLLPEYNILKSVGSLRGYIHSEEAKLKMRLSKIGFKHTEETKAKISRNLIHSEETKKLLRSYKHTKEALAKIKAAASLGRKVSEETKANIRANHPKSLKVKILNIETNITKEFLSSYQAAEYLGVTRVTIGNYIKSKKLYKNLYQIFI